MKTMHVHLWPRLITFKPTQQEALKFKRFLLTWIGQECENIKFYCLPFIWLFSTYLKVLKLTVLPKSLTDTLFSFPFRWWSGPDDVSLETWRQSNESKSWIVLILLVKHFRITFFWYILSFTKETKEANRLRVVLYSYRGLTLKCVVRTFWCFVRT